MCLFIVLRLNGQEATTSPPDSKQTLIPVYETITFPVNVSPDIAVNPFDPSDITVVATLIAPSSREVIVQGYWYQPYIDLCEDPCEGIQFQPGGDGEWAIQFTPDEVGEWEYTVQIIDGNAVVSTRTGTLLVEEHTTATPRFISAEPGQKYFQDQNGDVFFPIGHNLLWNWADNGGLQTYLDWLDDLAAHGGNYARILIDVPWFIGFEWGNVPGNYLTAQVDAVFLDEIIAKAEELGIKLQIVLLWNQALVKFSPPAVIVPGTYARPDTSADWAVNPYNIENGGFLDLPVRFFTDETAKAFFKRRLRYIVSRYAHSPAVFAWELIDDMGVVEGMSDPVILSWSAEMKDYLKEIDPYDHMVTVGGIPADLALTAGLDFASIDLYQNLPITVPEDQVTQVVELVQSTSSLPFPVLMTEFSINPYFEPVASDPSGIHVLNTLWAGMMSGTAGATMPDHWYTYVIPEDIQDYYAPFAHFTDEVQWLNNNFESLDSAILPVDGQLLPVMIDDFDREFGNSSLQTSGAITSDGLLNSQQISAYLYESDGNLPNEHVFSISLPQQSLMTIDIASSLDTADGLLQIYMDDALYSQTTIPANSANLRVSVSLPNGTYDLGIANGGAGWIEIGSLTFDNLRASLRPVGLINQDRNFALVWIQNREFTWQLADAPRTPQHAIWIANNLLPGSYHVEFWNPITGQIVGDGAVEVGESGQLEVLLPPIVDLLALKIERVE